MVFKLIGNLFSIQKLQKHTVKLCATQYPPRGPHAWCGPRAAPMGGRAFPPLGYAHYTHITGIRPLDTY